PGPGGAHWSGRPERRGRARPRGAPRLPPADPRGPRARPADPAAQLALGGDDRAGALLARGRALPPDHGRERERLPAPGQVAGLFQDTPAVHGCASPGGRPPPTPPPALPPGPPPARPPRRPPPA